MIHIEGEDIMLEEDDDAYINQQLKGYFDELKQVGLYSK